MNTADHIILPEFNGYKHEDVLAFLREYLEADGSFVAANLTDDEKFMRYFPFPLKENAKEWWSGLEYHSMTTWREVVDEFTRKYFSYGRMVELRMEVRLFKCKICEVFHNAYKRFKRMVRRCPNHDYSQSALNDFFYNGLSSWMKKRGGY